MSSRKSSSVKRAKKRQMPNPEASRFKQSSPVNLRSFEQHLNNLHLMGRNSPVVLVPGQQYSSHTASPIPSIEVRLEQEKANKEEMFMKNEDDPKFIEQEDTFGQFVEIDRGGKRKKKYKSYKIKKKTTKRKRKTRRKTRKRTRRKTKRKIMGKK